MNEPDTIRRVPTLLLAALPLVLLAGLVALFDLIDPTQQFKKDFPPIEELSIQRPVLAPGFITLYVINDGPDPVTIAQVQVDEAYWSHEILPAPEIPQLGKATIIIPYPWVKDDAYEVTLLTSTGATFGAEIPLAEETPRPTLGLFGIFALLGVYVGVIPVAIGLLWFPAIRRASQRSVRFFLFLTIGLLVFLGFDALEDSLEKAEKIPHVFQGIGLLVIGVIGTIVLLTAMQNLLKRRESGTAGASMNVATMVAIGIGLHNLGEGLAIGSAYALGNLSLGAMLVIGFTLHNTTEGLAIVSPLANTAASFRQLIVLGLIAGVPTIFGTWLGGFTYSPVWNLLFLSIGAGAIFQVAWQILSQLGKKEGSIADSLTFTNTAGLMTGFLIMYVTGIFVTA